MKASNVVSVSLCKKGLHPMVEGNIFLRRCDFGKTYKVCRACKNLRNRKSYKNTAKRDQEQASQAVT